MNLALDIGNTSTKWALFDNRTMVECGSGIPADYLLQAEQVLSCQSGKGDADWPVLDASTPVPISIAYKTPQTLGADRLADACGAWVMHPASDCLIIDAGTCITVDFLSSTGVYHGGAIMPGLDMQLQALHTFTAKLPLIEVNQATHAPILGRNTEESILAGTLGSTMLALAGYVSLYRQKSPQLHVILTGGDAARLTSAGTSGWECVPHLTLIGLNEIMLTNE